MKEHMMFVYSAVCALIISTIFGIGLASRSRDFNSTVTKALSTSVNYDQQFIGMVDRLEKELATRASFGYEGGKDPMTGQVRQVVVRHALSVLLDSLAKSAPDISKPTADSLPMDPFRLTAIIFDNASKVYTAVVMNGERSFSVGVGDTVSNRLIKGISEDAIVMEEDSLVYRYDVAGKSTVRKK